MALILAFALAACSKSVASIKSSSAGDVISHMTANGIGSGMPFDGSVDQQSDLDDLVTTARGNGAEGLHRGHGPVRNVLEEFLGIDHDEMHLLMEEEGLNLAGVSQHFGFDPDNLVESLTASFVPFIQEGIDNGVITEDEAVIWTEEVRTGFETRVYWEG
ncbi:MAG: hypothetical protein AB4050_18030 [Synechococcus sp.]